MQSVKPIDFAESGDYPGVMPEPNDYHNVPGWSSLEDFLRNDLGITHKRAIDTFRKYHNHYLKSFPVHYFTSTSIPEIDYALFFPVRGGRDNGSNNYHPHYLVAISENNGRTVIFHRRLNTSLRTRASFYRVTERWARNDFSGQRMNGADIGEILSVCERPEDLLALRKNGFSRFLDKLERKLTKMKQGRPFNGKWEQILKFLTERDRLFLMHIADKMKSEHVNFEAAHAAASVSQRNLDIYNWIMSGADARAIHNRTRLVPHYPWLAVALSNTKPETIHQTHFRSSSGASVRLPLAAHYATIERVIDSGAPLMEALEDLLSQDDPDHPIRQSTIRKTMGLRIGKDLLQPEKLSAALRTVDKHLPHLKLEEGMLERIYDVEQNAGAVFAYLRTSFGEALADAPVEIRERLLDKKGPGLRDFTDTTDYLDRVFNTITLPYFAYRAHLAQREGLTTAIRSYLQGSLRQGTFAEIEEGGRLPPVLRPFGNMMLHNVVALSVYWHNHREKSYAARYGSIHINRELRWPKLPDATYEDKTKRIKVSIKAHGSKSDLMGDYADFKTCIDGYSTYCLGLQERPGMERTYSHAFRIATESGGEKGTLVILEPYYPTGPKRDVTFFEIDGKRQAKDVRNPPSGNSPLVLAAHWYVANINNGKIPVNWARIDEERRANNTSSIRIQAEFDFTDKEKCEAAYMAMRPYLPERHRHLEYDQWIAKMGFDRDADILFGVSEKDLSLKQLNQLDFAP